MNDIDTLFFELIRVSIGKQRMLSRVPSAKEWQALYEMSKKQSLVGVCFAGVKKVLSSSSPVREDCSAIGLPELLYLKWMGMTAKIQQRNNHMNGYSKKALGYFREKGFACQVLKGQGLSSVYGNLAGLRQSGDVDVWLDCDRKKLYELSYKELGKVEGKTYHHVHYDIFPEVEIEAHIYPSFLSSPRRNKALHDFCELHKPTAGCAITPSLAFNRVFILLHCYRHFCGHGIGLRQLLDYYFVLVQGFSEKEKNDSMMWIEQMGMMRFCKATMWFMRYVFGMANTYQLCDPDKKNGMLLLEEVMKSGNFGRGDERNKINESALMRYLYNIKRDIRMMRICPHESLWDPVFNVYQFVAKNFVWDKM